MSGRWKPDPPPVPAWRSIGLLIIYFTLVVSACYVAAGRGVWW